MLTTQGIEDAMQDIQEPQMMELTIKLSLLTINDTQITEQGKQPYSNFVNTPMNTNCQDNISWSHLNINVCAYSLAIILDTAKYDMDN